MQHITSISDLSGQDLILQLDTRRSELILSLEDYVREGRALATAEREYRKAQAKLMLQLRAKDTPVTILSDLCKGDEKVGKLRFDRDVALVLYNGARELMLVLKKEVQILENEIEAERRGA